MMQARKSKGYNIIFYGIILGILVYVVSLMYNAYEIPSSIFKPSNIQNVRLLFLVVSLGMLYYHCVINQVRIPVALFIAIIYALIGSMFSLINGGYIFYQLAYFIGAINSWVSIMVIGFFTYHKKPIVNLHKFILLSLFMVVAIVYLNNYYTGDVITANSINSIYYVLIFLPFILMCDTKTIKVGGSCLIFFLVLLSLKRTALLAFLLAIFVNYLVESFKKKNDKRSRKPKRSILQFGVLLIILMLVYNYVINNNEINWVQRILSIETDGGSGRIEIYQGVWSMQKQSTLLEWIIGHGYNAVSLDSYFSSIAHNEVLEILYDYGLFAVLAIIAFVIKMAIFNIKLFLSNSKHTASFASSLVIFIVMSTTSQLVTMPSYFLILSFYWGIAMAESGRKL